MITKAWKALLQYRYALLVLLLGAVLLMLPEQTHEETPEAVEVAEVDTLEEKLEQVLRQVEGAGAVEVILTIRQGEETVYQTDLSQTAEGDSDANTVLADRGSTEAPIAVTVFSPIYQGALVVAEGGDRASVRLDIMQAVASLTGLGTDKITVIKMKMN